MAEAWKKALGLEIIQGYITGTVCVEHFRHVDFKRKNKKELKPGAIPHLSNNLTISGKNSTMDTPIVLELVISNKRDLKLLVGY